MSESRSSMTSADVQRELNEIADELYALRPDAFAAARDEQVRKARAEGRQPLARELAQLRKPTQSAWLINLLWRDQRDVMEQLFELATALRRAQAQASGPELQRLTVQRRELEAALIRRARALAEQAGVNVSATMEREAQETLAAALANDEVADEVRSGRLTKPASYAGFGILPSAVSPSAAKPAQVDYAPASAPPRKPDLLQDLAAQRDRERREAAERRVQEARAALEAAAGALADERRAAEAARQHQQELRARRDQLQEQLRDLEVEVAVAERAAGAAARRRDEAEKAHESAQRELEQAIALGGQR